MKVNLVKSCLGFLSVLLVFMLVGPSAAMAAQGDQVQKIADDLKYLTEEAAFYDENGDVIGLDFEKLEDRFGYVEEFAMLEQQIDEATSDDEVSPMLNSPAKWRSCMWAAIKDHFGLAFFEAAMTGGLWAYLKKKAYVEAAKLLLKIGVGGNIIGISAFLLYYGSKCMGKTAK